MVFIQIVYSRCEDIVNTWKYEGKTPTMQQCFILGIILIIRRQLFLRSKISTLLARNARKPEKTYHFSSIKFKWQLISYSVETHPILQNC